MGLTRLPWIISFASLTVTTVALGAEGKICRKCEKIREYNEKHHKNYDYYEDYLEDDDPNKDCDASKAGAEDFEIKEDEK